MNKTIKINGVEVEVNAGTYARIERTAEERKISFAEAVSFLLQKVI